MSDFSEKMADMTVFDDLKVEVHRDVRPRQDLFARMTFPIAGRKSFGLSAVELLTVL